MDFLLPWMEGASAESWRCDRSVGHAREDVLTVGDGVHRKRSYALHQDLQTRNSRPQSSFIHSLYLVLDSETLENQNVRLSKFSLEFSPPLPLPIYSFTLSRTFSNSPTLLDLVEFDGPTSYDFTSSLPSRSSTITRSLLSKFGKSSSSSPSRNGSNSTENGKTSGTNEFHTSEFEKPKLKRTSNRSSDDFQPRMSRNWARRWRKSHIRTLR